MIYDGPRDSFVSNARLALKLADTDIKFWADMVPKQSAATYGVGKMQQKHTSAIDHCGDIQINLPPRRNVTFAETLPPPKTERKSTVASAGTAARLFLRRSLHGFKKQECTACQNVVMDTTAIRVPCGHFYDVPCLLTLVKASMTDESLFPPKCCRELVPINLFERHLDAELSRSFANRALELNTPKRVYCAKIACSRFLGPRREGKGPLHVYDCTAPGCSMRTCSRCRCEVKKHFLHACRPDEVPRSILDRGLAQQCPGCDRLVELQSGCFHITCVCKTQFCYSCGSKWKTCKCLLFEDNRTPTTNKQRRPSPPRPPPPPPPILPPVPRSDRFRQTWIQATPTGNEKETEPLGKRRGRSSAPAQLQGYIPASESVVTRGVHAQERRAKQKAEPPQQPPSRSSAAPSHAGGSRGLDAQDGRIAQPIYTVQRPQCRHDWRVNNRTIGSCNSGNSADYSCLPPR